jgi:hypothetical protein
MLPPNLIVEAIHTAKIEQELRDRELVRIERHRRGSEPKGKRSFRLPQALVSFFARRRPAHPPVVAKGLGR